MTEKEFMDADFEVIGMVNKCHKYGPGPGGELPSKVVHFTPEEKPVEVTALDERIQKLQEAAPLIATAFVTFAFFIGLIL